MAPAKHKMPNVRLKRAPRYTPRPPLDSSNI